ncbi:hypothetical protein Tco_0122745 [Tanacetum coccineum]
MIDKYCPMGEIKKLEAELWNLKVKVNDRVKTKESEMITNQQQQQQNKWQNTGRAYAAGSGVLQMPMLLTIKGELGQVRNLLAMNVEPRDISRGIA